MTPRLHLESIRDADWTQQYLTNSGKVATRSYVCQLAHNALQFLLGRFFSFKTDFHAVNESVTRSILVLHNENAADNHDLIVRAEDKINALITKICEKQPERTNELFAQKIWYRDISHRLAEEVKANEAKAKEAAVAQAKEVAEKVVAEATEAAAPAVAGDPIASHTRSHDHK
jgi:hypothetical protein